MFIGMVYNKEGKDRISKMINYVLSKFKYHLN